MGELECMQVAILLSVVPILVRVVASGDSGRLQSLWMLPGPGRTLLRSVGVVARTLSIGAALAWMWTEGPGGPSVSLGGFEPPQAPPVWQSTATRAATVSLLAVAGELWGALLPPTRPRRPAEPDHRADFRKIR